MQKKIILRAKVVDSLLTYSLSNHPREGILLLRGRINIDRIEVEDIIIPPLSLRGESFSSFPMYMLPLDTSIIGTAHSHPSGTLKPSLDDLHHYYGAIMVIVGCPYESEKDIRVFDRKGEVLAFTVEG
ncbi:MAG: Mov34/MPN/PAD-1 family protein [Nitrososphaeria archaeon]